MANPQPLPSLPPRPTDAHKGTFGSVLVIAGSRGMMGAAALTVDAAYRAGAGLVYAAVPETQYPILAAKTTCAVIDPLPDTGYGIFAERALYLLRARVAGCRRVAIGPGLSTEAQIQKIVPAFLRALKIPAVVDADALNVLAGHVQELKGLPAPAIITPHPGEMARLLGIPTERVQAERRFIAESFARDLGILVVLKGRGTIVTDGKRTSVNATGNPGMATGGCGDVLTGAIAGLLAQGMDPYDAARLGVHLHGLAGDLAARKIGEVSLMATDVLTFLPEAFRGHGRKGRA